MKNVWFLGLVCLLLASCGSGGKEKSGSEDRVCACAGQGVTAGDCVEVLYFHGKQRCATCLAIERNTREVLEQEFADDLKKGKVVFRIVDLSQSGSQELAEKYEVTWSSLFVVRHRDGKETSENLTEFAFGNARKSPDTFKAGLVKTVSGMLK